MVCMVSFGLIMLIHPLMAVSNPTDKDSESNKTVSKGCYYKGQYHQGNWEDGCDNLCTCLNANTGHYKCRRRCRRYNSLPENCVLVLPVGSKCCKQPECYIKRPRRPLKYLHRSNGQLKDKKVTGILLQERYKFGVKSGNPDIIENPRQLTQYRIDREAENSGIKDGKTNNSNSKTYRTSKQSAHDNFVGRRTRNNRTSNFAKDKKAHLIIQQRQPVDTSIARQRRFMPEDQRNNKTTEKTIPIKKENVTRENAIEVKETTISSIGQRFDNAEKSNNSSETEYSQQDITDVNSFENSMNETEKSLTQQKLMKQSMNSMEMETKAKVPEKISTRDSDIFVNSRDRSEKATVGITNGTSSTNGVPNSGYNMKDEQDATDNDRIGIKRQRLINFVLMNRPDFHFFQKRRYPIPPLENRPNVMQRSNGKYYRGRAQHYNKISSVGLGLDEVRRTNKSSAVVAERISLADKNNVTPTTYVSPTTLADVSTISSEDTSKATSQSDGDDMMKSITKVSVTYRPIIPIYSDSNSSLKYKDKDWNLFVKELSEMFLVINRMKKANSHTKINQQRIKPELYTTKKPKINLEGFSDDDFVPRPRHHFYGRDQKVPLSPKKSQAILGERIGYHADEKSRKAVRTANRTVCIYQGKTYRPGETWINRCNKTCVCSNDNRGQYICQKEKCFTTTNVPHGCILRAQRTGCCPILDCIGTMKAVPMKNESKPVHSDSINLGNNVKFVRTATGLIRLQLSPNGTNSWIGTFMPEVRQNTKAFCQYKKRKYLTGEVWHDGCNSCRCINGMFGRYTCHVRCPSLSHIPNTCTLHMLSPHHCCPVVRCPMLRQANNMHDIAFMTPKAHHIRPFVSAVKNKVISPVLRRYFTPRAVTTEMPFIRGRLKFKDNESLLSDIRYLKNNRMKENSANTKTTFDGKWKKKRRRTFSRNRPRGIVR